MRRALTTACLLTLLLPVPVRPEEPPVFVRAFGREGSNPGLFRFPGGVAVDAQGNAYVVEILGNRVQKFDAEDGHLLTWTGSVESGAFQEPADVAVDRQGRVWVTDRGHNRLVWFDSEGGYLGSLGSALEDEFSGPNGLGLHPSQPLLFVADTFHGRVRVFDIAGAAPVPVADYGTQGIEVGHMWQPSDVAVSSKGEIHIAEPGINRIQIFSRDGRFRLSMGSGGNAPGSFNNPVGISVDQADDIYVVDTFNGRIQKFHRNGEFVFSWGISQEKIERLNRPLRIAITPEGLVYVCDTPGAVLDAHRIVVYQLFTTAIEERSMSHVRSLYR